MKKFISLVMAVVMCMTALCLNSFAAAAYSIKVSSTYGNGYTYVKLSCEGADIYYTTDGTVPDMNDKLYTAKLKFTKPATLRVAAYVDGKLVKRVKATVSVKAKKPSVTEAGTNGTQLAYNVTIPSKCTVYYTTDGTTPTAKNGSKAAETIYVGSGVTLKLVSVRSGWKNSSVVTVQVPEVNTAEDYAAEVLRLINAERKKEGLSELTTDENLTKAAQARAGELPTLFSHTRPDGSSCFTMLDKYDVTYWAAGENIAAGYPTPEAVVEGWMNSPGHRANILSDRFSAVGIGFHKADGGYGYYWAQVFIG